MTLYSFITFPRVADTSCLKSMVDMPKMFQVKDLKGTEWEKDCVGTPDDAYVYLGDSSDFDELQIGDSDPRHTFVEVFENQYVYSMTAQFNVYTPDAETNDMDIERTLEAILEYGGIRMTKDEYLKQRDESWIVAKKESEKHVARCRSQLYDLVKLNTSPGETMEIYSVWINKPGIFEFGPPTETRVIDVAEVLTSDLLDEEDGLRTEIRNAKR